MELNYTKSVKNFPIEKYYPVDEIENKIIHYYNSGVYTTRNNSLRNYIPHNPRRVGNKYTWQQAYYIQLKYIYRIVKRIITLYFPKYKINWDNPQIYTNLLIVLYHCSSKYISPFLENYDDEYYDDEYDDEYTICS